jgi:hypothetical protein
MNSKAPPSDLRSQAGRYVQQSAGCRAFIPAPLPPRPPVALPGTLQALLSEADRTLGRFYHPTASCCYNSIPETLQFRQGSWPSGYHVTRCCGGPWAVSLAVTISCARSGARQLHGGVGRFQVYLSVARQGIFSFTGATCP